MKKLFTTILMMGIALVGWADPVISSEVSSDGKTLTLSYVADPGQPNFLQQLADKDKDLNDWIGVGPIERELIETVVLVGDFTNYDFTTNGKIIEKILDKCCKPNGKRVFLDLSACDELYCKVIPQSGTYSSDIDWTTTKHRFKYTENEGDPTRYTVTQSNSYYFKYNNSKLQVWQQDQVAGPDADGKYWWQGYIADDGGYAYHEVYPKTVWGYDPWNNGSFVEVNPSDIKHDEATNTDYVLIWPEGNKLEFTKIKDYINGVSFPNSDKFTAISDDLCKEYTGLVNVVFGDNVEWIGERAFAGCTALTDPVFPTSMKVFAGDCFKDCNSFTKVDLSLLPKIQIVDYMAFGSSGDATATSNLAEFILPSNNTSLKYFANYVIRGTKVKKLDFSGCKGIVNFAHDGKATFGEFSSNWDKYWTFYGSSELEEIILPPNLVYLTEKAFNTCPKLKKVTFGDNCLLIDKAAFQKCYTLEEVKFPIHIVTIEEDAFEETGLKKVDLSACHELRTVEIGAFGTIPALTDVKICSHPKVLRGNGHGTGCFNNCKNIETVEITACHTPENPVTDITQCYCEIGAFDYDITEVQTQIDNVSKGAKLIFPADMPVGNNQVYAGTTHQSGTYVDDQGVERQTFGIEQGTAYTNPYTSAFDFFVGDFKSGVMLSQTNLQVLYNDVPNNLGPAPGYGKPVNQPELGEYVPGLSQNEDDKYVGDTRYSYNGWIEFINTEDAMVVPQGKFLRTYSRSIGDGPCLLPKEITAYRAVDYKSVSRAWVQDKRNGTHYYSDPTVPVDQRVDEQYIEITKDTDKSLYAGGNRYSFVTTGGTLYLKPLVAKKAYAVVNGTTYSGYTDENKDFFDSEAIYNGNVLTNVEGGYSYVPENTGVVLYSDAVDEKALLVLKGDDGTDIVYKEFHHTGARYEEQRRAGGEGVNTDNDINMLQGSYGEGCAVAPVSPWVEWDEYDEENHVCSGGHYSFDEPKAYRNFACVNTNYGQEGVEKTYGWRRLTPSWMKENRAYAKIPVGRFDNNNESQSQMPDFSKDDLPEEDTTGGNGTNVDQTFGDNTLISIFDDGSESGAVVDGIKTVNIVVVNADNDAWYTTQGVRISHPTKGVYIHNGKKVVIK